MKVLVLVLDHEVLVWLMNVWPWSWTRSRRKSLAVFKNFVVILDVSEQGTPWHFVRDNKSSLPFGSRCLREPSALHAWCTSASVKRVFNNGGYLLGHTDANKAQCQKTEYIDCGPCFHSVAINQESKLLTGWNVI